VFSRPEVIGPLKGEFVPFAGDKWYLNRQQDADGAFLRKLGAQREGTGSPSASGCDAPQGIYIAAPDGTLLAADHFHPDPERLLARMRDARERWQKIAPPARNAAATDTGPGTSSADARFARRPPAGGLILKVFSRIPLPPPAGQTWTPNQATGRDHVWLTAEEQRALLPSSWKNGVRYPVAPAVVERLARFHLVDNVRGEPPFWTPGDLRRVDLSLTVEDAAAGLLRLDGVARMDAGGRGYDARVQGYLSVDRVKKALTRFDLLAWGDAWGEGIYTRGAPPGRFPLLIAAALVRGDAGADQVPPQASRDLAGYFGTGRRVPAASLR
jgi:hypothetical protein